MQRALIIAGIVILAAGLAWPLLMKLHLGRLPGDFVIDRPGLKVFFPLTTTLLISGALSLLFWLLHR